MLLLVLVASFGSASASGLECPGEPASQLPESWPALSPLSGRRSPPRAARACSRKENNRRQRALHGNIHLVIANITALGNLRLALAERPDVLLAQELWASREQVKAEAKAFGYSVAVSREEPCLAAVF